MEKILKMNFGLTRRPGEYCSGCPSYEDNVNRANFVSKALKSQIRREERLLKKLQCDPKIEEVTYEILWKELNPNIFENRFGFMLKSFSDTL